MPDAFVHLPVTILRPSGRKASLCTAFVHQSVLNINVDVRRDMLKLNLMSSCGETAMDLAVWQEWKVHSRATAALPRSTHVHSSCNVRNGRQSDLFRHQVVCFIGSMRPSGAHQRAEATPPQTLLKSLVVLHGKLMPYFIFRRAGVHVSGRDRVRAARRWPADLGIGAGGPARYLGVASVVHHRQGLD